MKYLQLTVDRLQPTLFECLNHAFEKFGGVPEEIWFDNMKQWWTILKVNSQMLFQLNDSGSMQKMTGFKPIACRPFRPQTKGKVEALARTVDRLLALTMSLKTLKNYKHWSNN
ncbi:hypothetical protein LLT7_12745 [Lactococcus cremoris subsp. cremoris TIFN7]|nr:hypothetical protein LLT7_12745 [Lactococcus cremoris subsp. cremoris TIFN7]